ncbi:MAG: Fe-S cluster assembly protein SufD [Variibacter sp.]|nr:Fe-S cluster assembly protein SufD [Variibacter sp.]
MAAELAVVRSPAEEAILARYPAFKARQAHWGGAAVARARDRAFDLLKARGLPNRRVEEWKYTDLRAVMRELPEPFDAHTRELVDAAAKMQPAVAVPPSTSFLFVNGRDCSSGGEQGIEWDRLQEGHAPAPSLAQALARKRSYADDAAVALNTAFMSDTTLLRVPAGVKLAKPVHLQFSEIGEQPFATYPRVLVVVEAGASATIVETHDGPDGVAYQTNALIEIELGAGARVEHVQVNTAGDQAVALSTLGVWLGEGAELSSLAFATGGAVTRNQVFATFAGAGAKASIRGATLLRGRQHVDNTLIVDHAKGGGESRELFKTVLDDQSRGVFQGKIIVRPDAQKTDGKMAAHALLLSEEAEADAKPELEIFADDVVCGHGATAGALDDELLFYLRARGIPKKEAEALMVQAFVGEAIEPVENEAVRDALAAAAERWLTARA